MLNKKRKKPKLQRFMLILCLVLIIFFIGLYFKTGFLNKSAIDKRDFQYWNYSDGLIVGAEEIRLEGDNDVCWLLLHGYTSTPDEMRDLSLRIYKEFNETVIVPRMWGCGEVPSHILNLTLEDWYTQSEQEFESLKEKCGKVNVVGFSFGGALAIRLAETKEINNLYLLSPYLIARYKLYKILKLETLVDIFTEIATYSKKAAVAQISSEEGLKDHIAYWNMPFAPVKYSKYFLRQTIADLSKINSPVLIQQSKKDETSDIRSSITVFGGVNSSIKELKVFEKSNHVLTEDYDKQEVMDNIINFENQLRI